MGEPPGLAEVIEKDRKYHLQIYGERRSFPDILLVKGEGVIVTDSTGKDYIDCVAGISCENVGHNNPLINQKIEQRIEECKKRLGIKEIKPSHYSNLFYLLFQGDCAEAVSKAVPIDNAKIFFCNSGAEATNGAIKLAALNPGYWLVYVSGTFHGRYGASLAATGQEKFHIGFEKTLPPNTKITRFNNLDDLELITKDTYAVIFELIEAEGGVRTADRAYIDALRQRCRDTGTLLIADEVQTGFGRTGKMFASQHYDLFPDAVCMAKAIANGYPFGAIAFAPDFANMIEAGKHASTFGGNSRGCLEAMAVLDIIREQNLLENAQAMEKIFYSVGFQGLPHVKDARGKGLLLGVELDSVDYRKDVINACKEDGVLFCGCGDSVIRIVPPLTITEDQFSQAMKVLKKNITNLVPKIKD